MDLQDRGLSRVIFAVGGLKIVVQLVSTEMAFQACNDHFVKDSVKDYDNYIKCNNTVGSLSANLQDVSLPCNNRHNVPAGK